MAIVNEDTTRIEFDHFNKTHFYLDELIHIHEFIGSVIKFFNDKQLEK